MRPALRISRQRRMALRKSRSAIRGNKASISSPAHIRHDYGQKKHPSIGLGAGVISVGTMSNLRLVGRGMIVRFRRRKFRIDCGASVHHLDPAAAAVAMA